MNDKSKSLQSTILVSVPCRGDQTTDATHLGQQSYRLLCRFIGLGFLLILFCAFSAQNAWSQITVNVPQVNTSGYAAEIDGEYMGPAVLDVQIANTSTLTSPITINYVTSPISAQPGADYTPVTGTLIFSSTNPATQPVAITITNDFIKEANEKFRVTWSSPDVNVTLPVTQSDVIIYDYDCFSFFSSTIDPDEDDGNTTFYIYFGEDFPGTITLDYATINTTGVGIATANSDYVPINGTLTFNSGGHDSQSLIIGAQSVSVSIIDDILGENDETVTLGTSNPSNGTSICQFENKSSKDILENDKFYINDQTVSESNGPTGLTVTPYKLSQNGGFNFNVTVNLTPQDGSAVLNSDYLAFSTNSLNFTNDTPQNFTVPIVNDTAFENGENFFAKLSTSDGPTFDGSNGDDTGQVTIAKNDEFSINSITVDEDVVNAILEVSLLTANTLTTSVAYATSDGTANAGVDYTAISGTLIFAPNETAKTISVPILNDLLTEPSEIFTVTLSNPAATGVNNPAIGNGTGIVTITLNDLLTFTNPISVNESALNATIVLTMSESNTTPVTVDFTTTDNTAVFNQDFPINSGTVTFSVGTTTTNLIIPIHDTLDEYTEHFTVTLATSNGPTIPTPNQISVTIIDDDTSDVRITKGALPSNVSAGTLFDYQIVVSNIGNGDAVNGIISDTLPTTGINFVGPITLDPASAGTIGSAPLIVTNLTITNGQSVTVTIPYSVAKTVAGIDIVNTAIVTTSMQTTTVSTRTAQITTTILSPELSIAKSSTPANVKAGQALTYTLTIVNAGQGTANDVNITDTLPSNVTYVSMIDADGFTNSLNGSILSFYTATIAPQTTHDIIFTVDVDLNTLLDITNTVEITNVTPLSGTGALTDTLVTPLLPPILEIIKSATVTSLSASETFTYELVVSNSGGRNAANTFISDTIPTGLNLVGPITFDGIVATPGTPPNLASGLTISMGKSITLTFPVSVSKNVAGVDIVNTAKVTSTESSTVYLTQTSQVTITVLAPEIQIAKSVTPTPTRSDATLTYSLTVVNLGPGLAHDVTITDTLPSNVIFGGVINASGFTATPSGSTLTFFTPTLSANITHTFVFTVRSIDRYRCHTAPAAHAWNRQIGYPHTALGRRNLDLYASHQQLWRQ